jgi:hypothetical protein
MNIGGYKYSMNDPNSQNTRALSRVSTLSVNANKQCGFDNCYIYLCYAILVCSERCLLWFAETKLFLCFQCTLGIKHTKVAIAVTT